MSEKQLSIIIPGCNEWPQNIFTMASIAASLDGLVDYEIIYVDNQSQRAEDRQSNASIRGDVDGLIDSCIHPDGIDRLQLANCFESYVHGHDIQGADGDFTSMYMNKNSLIESGNLVYLKYDDTASHWQAKNKALEIAKGRILMFIDAHNFVQRPDLARMYDYYIANEEEINGSLHMPIMGLLDRRGKQNIYKLEYNKPKGILHYSFTGIREREKVHKVPSMIWCSAMISRDILVDRLGGWPKTMGIWGGGEHFANYALAVTGHDVNIWPFGTMRHFAGKTVKRGYSWNHADYHRNRMLAVFIVGGAEWLQNYADTKQAEGWAEAHEVAANILNTPADVEHHALIEKQTIIPIEEWVKQWKESELVKEIVA